MGGIAFNAVWYRAARAGLLTGSAGTPPAAPVRPMVVRFLLGPVLYAVGTLLTLLSWQAAVAVFAALIVFYWLPVRSGLSSRAQPDIPTGERDRASDR